MLEIFSPSCTGRHQSHATIFLLGQITIRSRVQIVANWQQKHLELYTVQKYAVHFGQGCIKAMAKSLIQLKLSYKMLQSAFEDSIDHRQAFYKSWNHQESLSWENLDPVKDEGQHRSFFVGCLSSKMAFIKAATQQKVFIKDYIFPTSSWSKQLFQQFAGGIMYKECNICVHLYTLVHVQPTFCSISL